MNTLTSWADRTLFIKNIIRCEYKIVEGHDVGGLRPTNPPLGLYPKLRFVTLKEHVVRVKMVQTSFNYNVQRATSLITQLSLMKMSLSLNLHLKILLQTCIKNFNSLGTIDLTTEQLRSFLSSTWIKWVHIWICIRKHAHKVK